MTIMACGSCGSRKSGTANAGMEYLITYRDGTTDTAPDLASVRRKLALSDQGGQYRLVTKKSA